MLMLPNNALVFLWRASPAPTFKKTCSLCRYELIDGWCSRCDLDRVASTSAG